MVDPPEFDWENCDASEAEETVVLLGAGASADAGLPTALDLHQQLAQCLGPLAPLYSNLASLVFPGDQAIDVERLFRVIQFVHAFETAERSQDQRLDHESLDIAQLVDQWKPKLQDYLEYQEHTVQGTASGQLIDALWDALFTLLWIPPNDQRDLAYLRWLLRSMRGGMIATLNYDNCLERAALQGVGQPLDADTYPRDYSLAVPGPSRAEVVRIVKLHGSLNWATDSDESVRVLSDNDLVFQRLANQGVPFRPPLPGIIFGAGNKLRAQGPYLDLYVEFKNALAEARRLIVIGYGWSDPHINQLLRRWLERFDTPRVVRVGALQSPLASRSPWMHWTSGNATLEVQIINGRAAETMVALTKPKPDFLRS